MAKQTLNNLDLASLFRTKLNENFTELYDGKQDKALSGQTAPTLNVYAKYTTNLAGANNDLVWTSRRAGVLGNLDKVLYVNGGVSFTPLTVAVTVDAAGYTLTITPVTDGAGTITSTATQVKAAYDAYALANPTLNFFSCTNAASDTGAGAVVAFSIQSLAGGVDGTVGYNGQKLVDTNGVLWECLIGMTGAYLWCPSGFPALGVVYPTLDVYYDKASSTVKRIKKLAFDWGTLPNATTVLKAHGITTGKVMLYDANVQRSSGQAIIPTSGGAATLSTPAMSGVNNESLAIVNNYDQSAQTGIYLLWFWEA